MDKAINDELTWLEAQALFDVVPIHDEEGLVIGYEPAQIRDWRTNVVSVRDGLQRNAAEAWAPPMYERLKALVLALSAQTPEHAMTLPDSLA